MKNKLSFSAFKCKLNFSKFQFLFKCEKINMVIFVIYLTYLTLTYLTKGDRVSWHGFGKLFPADYAKLCHEAP